MKKILYIIVFTFLGYSFQSCDLETDPTNAAAEDVVFDNAVNAEKVLNGTWAYMMETFYTYANPGWASLFRTSDAMGNDIAMQPNKYGFYAQYSYTATISTSSGTVQNIWAIAYKTIDNMNHLITKIDGVPGDATLKARVKSQAYALRGYMYLNMATYFAGNYKDNLNERCVPIYLTPTNRNTEGNPRETVEKVYKQAEDDLLEAYKGIGSYSNGSSKHKINKSIISGILARLYLQTESWVDAEKYAKEAETPYKWMAQTDYLGGFNDQNNPEWIWGHGQTADQSNASYNFHYLDVSSSSSYYYSFMADPYFKDLFDENDIRTQLFEWDATRFQGGLMYKKFRFKSDQTGDIVMMRKAEMVLIEAEALAGQNKLPEAIAKLNELRAQRGANQPDLSALSKDQLTEVILIERRKELFGEGFSLYDIKRKKKSVIRKEVPSSTTVVVGSKTLNVQGHTILKFPDGKDFTADSPYYIFAIPASETQNNPNLNK